MIYTIVVILVILWLIGMLSSFTLNGFIHVLLVLAVIIIVVKLLRGKKIL